MNRIEHAKRSQMCYEDCQRIIKVSRELGDELTYAEATMLWEQYSDEVCAAWLKLPKSDEELKKILLQEVN